MDPNSPSHHHHASMSNDVDDVSQQPRVNPIQWPTDLTFSPSQMNAAQAAAFASFFQQQFSAQQHPSVNLMQANATGQFQGPSDSRMPSSQTGSRSTQGSNRKSPNWKVNEDVALCQAWVRISEDPIIGNGQAHDAFWFSIWTEFKLRTPGTERVQRACENRWAVIQADVSKWRAIVKRVQRVRASGTNPNDEWGAALMVFKKDHGRDFKLIHCWEILRTCSKWHISTDEKEARDVGRGGKGGNNRSRFSNSSHGLPVHNVSASSSLGLDDYPNSYSPTIDPTRDPTPTSESPVHMVGNNDMVHISREPAITRPLGRKAAKEKRRRSIGIGSQASSAASEKLSATVNAWRESSESRLDSLKQISEEQAFHATKMAKLDALEKALKITTQFADAEKGLLSIDSDLNRDEIISRQLARVKDLDDLDKEFKRIRALEYSPKSATRLREGMEGTNLDPVNLYNRFNASDPPDVEWIYLNGILHTVKYELAFDNSGNV
ncbi:glutathione S-transferase T3-like isoform X2 [Tripterygium wilfordii]|uniref:glutathione S-transferase T3-like isoform X1 n=1 Tax=Tripterygium wilfordii TaxID=458696 RepID=UPI0018F82F96|nr:glutathione S-transferase T3-like isoform X1 [Tripterygium wilfordii]XP_038716126.1 glutathione S-transferase T3-like isoform X2 [Tripterygium wilfordii]